jgi:hypothetical protein
VFAGTLLVCDATTIWSAAFLGLESLEVLERLRPDSALNQ